MDIFWLGHSCFKIKGKTATVVIDPFNPEATGLKLSKDIEAQVVLSTHQHDDHNFLQAVPGTPLAITGPGEYEVARVSIVGISSFHDATEGTERGINTVYNILIDGINIVHLGDLGHALTDEQVNQINAEILMIPVGGVYTINADTASKVIAQLEPRIIIPMHYKTDGLKYDLEPLDYFLKIMGSEPIEPQAKLTATKDKLPEETQIVVLNKS